MSYFLPLRPSFRPSPKTAGKDSRSRLCKLKFLVHWLTGGDWFLYSDAFQRRERANEDWAIRQREKERLLELKKKLAEQQQHLQRLSDHMLV